MAVASGSLDKDTLSSGVIADRGTDNWGANWVWHSGGLKQDISHVGNSMSVSASGAAYIDLIDPFSGVMRLTSFSGGLTLTQL